MGNLFTIVSAKRSVNRRYVRLELSSLLYKVIKERVNNSRLFTSYAPVNSKHLYKLKDQMRIVRSISDKWHTLTLRCANSGELPHLTIDKLLHFYPTDSECLKLSHVLCLCTYAVDVCVITLLRNDVINVNMLIETVIEYLLKRDTGICVKLLELLDI